VRQISKEVFDLLFSEWLDTRWKNADPCESEKSFDTMSKSFIYELP
jgi:hypothetical protein